MNVHSKVSDGFGRWIDSVAATATAAVSRFAFPLTVELLEEGEGAFVLRARKGSSADLPLERLQIADGRIVGAVSEKVAALLRKSHVELVLRPVRFVFRPLELPSRASEFLDGVVRSQIDRLTPWSAGEAVFGFSLPAEIAPDRIVVTVAATSRAQVAPYVTALADAGADFITVTTLGTDQKGDQVSITVLEERTRTVVDVARVRTALAAILIMAALAAVASIGSATVIGMNLAAKQDELARKIAERRAALRAGTGPATLSTLGKLELRKHETPASVIVIEVLSRVLPDHTYVTELRIEGDKLRLTGVTRDAPSLIRLIEQSSPFARATFFAPTTRAPSDPGDRFHIEAQIGPVVAPRS